MYRFCTELQFGTWCSPLVQSCAPNHEYQNYSYDSSGIMLTHPACTQCGLHIILGARIAYLVFWQGRDRILVGARGLSVFQTSRLSLGAIWPPIQWVLRGTLLGSKGARREADHSPPCIVEVKSEWNCDSAPRTCVRGMCRENFTFCTKHDCSPVWHATHFRLGGVTNCTLHTAYCKWSDIRMLRWTEKATHVKIFNTISNFESLILSKLMSSLASLLSFSCSNWLLAHC